MEIGEWSEFVTECRIREAIPCKQQIADPYSTPMACWPCGRVGVEVAEKKDDDKRAKAIESEARKRNGVWRDVTTELEENPELAGVGFRGDDSDPAETVLDSDVESSYSYSYSPSEQVDYSA